jgi:hypothetical protein
MEGEIGRKNEEPLVVPEIAQRVFEKPTNHEMGMYCHVLAEMLLCSLDSDASLPKIAGIFAKDAEHLEGAYSAMEDALLQLTPLEDTDQIPNPQDLIAWEATIQSAGEILSRIIFKLGGIFQDMPEAIASYFSNGGARANREQRPLLRLESNSEIRTRLANLYCTLAAMLIYLEAKTNELRHNVPDAIVQDHNRRLNLRGGIALGKEDNTAAALSH